MAEEGRLQKVNKLSTLIWLVVALVCGWKLTSTILIWLVHGLSSKLNATANIMSSSALGFILGLALMFVLLHNFNTTLKVVAWGLLIGFIAHWGALLIMENKHMDTDVWWMAMDRGSHLAALAAHQVPGAMF